MTNWWLKHIYECWRISPLDVKDLGERVADTSRQRARQRRRRKLKVLERQVARIKSIAYRNAFAAVVAFLAESDLASEIHHHLVGELERTDQRI